MYADFVDTVDPKGYVIDCLIQHRIFSVEVAQRVRIEKTTQERCRAMLDQLLTSKHRQAFVILREALMRDYGYIVEDFIDKGMSAEHPIKLK